MEVDEHIFYLRHAEFFIFNRDGIYLEYRKNST